MGDRVKRLFIFFSAIIMLLFAGCDNESRPKLVIATNANFPPYEYISNGEIDGIDPYIIRTIGSKLGYDIVIQNMNFEGVITAVQTGKADIAASGLSITEDRKQKVLFSIPYVIAEQKIIVKKDSDINSDKDLSDKKIGVQLGTTGDTFINKNYSAPQRYKNGAEAISALLSNKIDVVIIDKEPAEIFVAKNSELKLLEEPLTREEYAFAFNKKNQELLDKFNAELQKMKDSGELEKIIKKYLSINSKTAPPPPSPDQGFLQRFKHSFELNFIKEQRYKYLLKGFINTLEITFLALILGILIGFSVAVLRCTADQTGKFKVLDFLCRVYLTVIRGTPVVVQLLIIYFVIFRSVNVDKTLVAIIAFGINSGAYVAEIVRGGIMAIDKGQMEAGRSLGLSYAKSMKYIIMPQAVKNVLPSLGNEFIVLLKETSVAGYIALEDLTKGGDIIRSQTYDAFMPLIAVAIIYLAVVMLLTKLLEICERKLKKNE